MIHSSDLHRFHNSYSYTTRDACWIWKGPKHSKSDYGIFNNNHKKSLAHRFSWRVFRGEIPEGLKVLHKCDNPICINPYHLFLGTQEDNILDMVKKGRQAKGESHARSASKRKLSDAEVLLIFNSEIRKPSQVASQFGITRGQVHNIWIGKCFKYLTEHLINKRV